MPVQIDEANRIQRRIDKALRRIAKGYVGPQGKETEEHRVKRLSKRLEEIKAEVKS